MLLVEPVMVLPMGAVELSNFNGPLPEAVTCSIIAGSGQKLQEVTINTSGDAELRLNDKYGALRVRSCGDVTCIEELYYQYNISNTGSADMELTVANRTFNGRTEDLLGRVPVNPVPPGQSVSFVEQHSADVCNLGQHINEIIIKADPLNGQSCQTRYDDRLVVIPDCRVNLDMNCSFAQDGSDCSTLSDGIIFQCVCSECVTKMVFRYTAAPCGTSASEKSGLVSCSDFFDLQEKAEMWLSVRSGAEVIYGGMVTIGTDITIHGTGCIGENLNATLSDPEQGTVFQNIEVDTACKLNSHVSLMENFGSLAFIGYTCLDEEAQFCYADIVYDLLARNTGDVNLTVTDFTVEVNAEADDLIAGLNESSLKIMPGAEFAVNRNSTLHRCSSDSSFRLQATVMAETDFTGKQCSHVEGFIQPLKASTSFPTISPTDSPSLQPSQLPSDSPSDQPSSDPSQSPSTVPSEPPSFPPSPAPTKECILTVDVECKLANNNNYRDGELCEAQQGVEPCLERPTSATMLYRGGDCSQSNNIQPLKSTCEDRNGGPPTQTGEASYIVVTDAKGNGIVYFSGFVKVGEFFSLNDQGERFEADQIITIYKSDDLGVTLTLLQIVRYHSSCSSNLELKNQFGASQLVGFVNEIQGNVTCFATASFDLSITVPIDIDGDTVTLHSLQADTSFAGPLNLTNQVEGSVVQPGGSVMVTLQGTIDLTVRNRYQLDATLMGTGPSGELCRGTTSAAFFAGNPSARALPTTAPTITPTISPAPTTDPFTTPCEVQASISCTKRRDRESSESTCTSLMAPSAAQCSNSDSLTRLRWLYNGFPCSASTIATGKNFKCQTENGGLSFSNPSNVHVMVENTKKQDDLQFERSIKLGETFVLGTGDGGFPDKIQITISTDANGQAGVKLQELEIRTECKKDNEIVLLGQYGALQLIAFESDNKGLQSAFEVLELTYMFENAGSHPMIIENVWLNSSIFGQRTFVNPPGMQLGAGEAKEFEYSIPLSLYDANGLQVFNELVVDGTAAQNSNKCNDTAVLDFTVGS